MIHANSDIVSKVILNYSVLLNRITCLEGVVPWCFNVKDEKGEPTGRFKGLEVEVMQTVGKKIGFETAFLESGNSGYNKKTQEWTNGTMRQVNKTLLMYFLEMYLLNIYISVRVNTK